MKWYESRLKTILDGGLHGTGYILPRSMDQEKEFWRLNFLKSGWIVNLIKINHTFNIYKVVRSCGSALILIAWVKLFEEMT